MFPRLILPTLVALAVFVPASGHAVEYPWCAQYGPGSVHSSRNCGFSTFEQCLASVRGVGGFCEHNSFYTGPENPARNPRKKRQAS